MADVTGAVAIASAGFAAGGGYMLRVERGVLPQCRQTALGVVAVGQQALAQMRAEKTGPAGDENTFGDNAHRTIFPGGHASTRNSGRTIRGGRPTLT